MKPEQKTTNTFSSVKLEPVPQSTIQIASLNKKVDPHEQYYSRMIPRTGIEQPFLIDPPYHIRKTQDLERTNEGSQMLKINILEEYRMRETGRIINLAKTVFDVERDSPHYKNSNEYLDPSKQIRIWKPTTNGRPLDNPKFSTKNRYFKELKPWYVPYNYGIERKIENLAQEDDVLIFESRFESGNLKKAI